MRSSLVMTQDWSLEGDAALALGDTSSSDIAYSQAIILEPTRCDLFAKRSAARLTGNRFPEALHDAHEAVRLEPSFAIGHLRVGRALEAMQRTKDAIEAYQVGLRYDPRNEMLLEAKEALGVQQEVGETISEKYEVFLDWLRKGEAQFPKIVLQQYDDEHRGVHAADTIVADEVVVMVPRRLIITSEHAINSDIGRSIIKSGVEVRSRHTFLAAYLLQERARPDGSPSPFAPYLNVLPQRFDNIPLNFTRDELSYLKGSMAVDKIKSRIESLKLDYNRLVKSVPEFATFSYDDFVWSRCVVITRIFGITVDGKKTEALVPLADFLNHRRPRETVWMYEPRTDCFTINALGNFQPGAQISDSYGRKCNSRFFTNYGFCLENNEDNEAVIRLMLDPDDKALRRKLALFGIEDLNVERIFTLPATINNSAAIDETMSYLRLICATNDDLDRLLKSDIPNLRHIRPLSCRNETSSLSLLKASCRRSLAGFETTLDEDLELLDRGGLTRNIKNCIVMRVGEKRVLQFFISFVNDVLPLLSLSRSDLDWIMRSCQKRHLSGPFDRYICIVVERLLREHHEQPSSSVV